MRVVNRLGSLLLAFVLLAGGLLLVIETVAAALRVPSLIVDRDGWYNTLARTRLDDPHVQSVTIGMTALGILILLVQLRSWGPDRVEVGLGEGWHLHRRSVEQRLASTADDVPGISSARARIRRRGDSWRPRIWAVGDPSIRPKVEQAVRQELERLAAPRTQAVEVQLVAKRGAR